MKPNRIVLLIVSLILLAINIHAQTLTADTLLPFDESVTIGHLENGLTYYIKQNTEPKDMAYLYLVVKVGSVDENEDQRGLAHFLEHSAFNGTTNFPGNSLREYLNSVGSGLFGGSNAMTSFDFTIYILETKTTDLEQLDKFVMILSDYSARLLLTHEAIDKERGIILEERRLHSGAQQRMNDKIYPVLFYGSQYSVRLPIGIPEVIANFPYKTLEDFYQDWYRPDLQAVVAVGDFDVATVKSYIEKHFSDIPARVNPRQKVVFEVPPHADTKYVYATDKEATDTTLQIYYKSPAPSSHLQTVEDQRRKLVEYLLNSMLNKRFSDIARSPNPPFTRAYAGSGNFINPLYVYILGATVDETHIIPGFTALITETQRVIQHGFHDSELVNAKANVLSMLERALSEKDKTDSNNFVGDLVQNFTDGSRVMDIDNEFAISSALLEDITLDEIYTAIDAYLTEENRVVVLQGPDTIDDSIPSEADILNIFDMIASTTLDAYAETTITEPLMAKIPKKKSEKKPVFDNTLNIYTWTLKNGAKIYLKPTDFKNNEIYMNAYRIGGLSQAEDKVFKSVKFATQIQNASGLGQFDAIQLSTYLTGKDLRFSTGLGMYTEQISGRSSIKDFETLMQMTHLNFTSPRLDETAFEVWQGRQEIQLRNQLNNPQYLLFKTFSEMIYNDHFRTKFDSVEDILAVNHRTAFDYFKSRFSSATGYNFIFVGNITPDDLQGYIETYIATLPNKKVKTNIIDRHIKTTETLERKDIFKGEEMSMVVMQYNNSMIVDWSTEQKIQLMNSVFQEMLFENIREKMSGVYVIQSYPMISRFDINQVSLTVMFGCDPERVEEIIAEIDRQLGILLNNEFDDLFVNTARETLKKEYEQSDRENSSWIEYIKDKQLYGFSSEDVLRRASYVETITRDEIAEIANKCLDRQKCVTAVLYPEEFKQ